MEKHEPKIKQAKRRAKRIIKRIPSMGTIAESVGAKLSVAQDTIETSSEHVVNYVNEHPMKAVAIAGVVCYLLGRLMK